VHTHDGRRFGTVVVPFLLFATMHSVLKVHKVLELMLDAQFRSLNMVMTLGKRPKVMYDGNV
jgi:hypothetical protein